MKQRLYVSARKPWGIDGQFYRDAWHQTSLAVQLWKSKHDTANLVSDWCKWVEGEFLHDAYYETDGDASRITDTMITEIVARIEPDPTIPPRGELRRPGKSWGPRR